MKHLHLDTAGANDPSAGAAIEALCRRLESLGLTASEARVLVALLHTGSASTLELARLSGVPRASAYQVIDELAGKGLIERVPGEGLAIWSTQGPEEVLGLLGAMEDERHSRYQSNADALRAALAQVLPATRADALPRMRALPNGAQWKRVTERLFAETRTELLVLSRPPYLNVPTRPLAPVLDLLKRGVPARCLTRPSELDDPHAPTFRPDVAAYAGAGMQMRLVDELEVKLVVSDRRMAAFSLVPGEPTAYPASMLVEDPGLAALLADGFEHRWVSARPWGADLDCAVENLPG